MPNWIINSQTSWTIFVQCGTQETYRTLCWSVEHTCKTLPNIWLGSLMSQRQSLVNCNNQQKDTTGRYKWWWDNCNPNAVDMECRDRHHADQDLLIFRQLLLFTLALVESIPDFWFLGVYFGLWCHWGSQITWTLETHENVIFFLIPGWGRHHQLPIS